MALELCRVCNGTENLKNVLGDSHLQELLQICANVTVSSGDLMPKQICEKCELGLEFSYRLRKQAEATEIKQRSAMSQQNEIVNNITEKEEISMGLEQSFAVTQDDEFINEIFENVENLVVSDYENTTVSTPAASPKMDCEQDEFIYETDTYVCEPKELDSENVDLSTVALFSATDNTSEMSVTNKEIIMEAVTEEVAQTAEISANTPLLSAYMCATCGLVFDNQRARNEHVRSHGEKRFECVQCHKWFPSRARLKIHESCHRSNVEHFRCEHCDRLYGTHGNLLRHIRATHDTERMYKCIQCNESFGRPDVLKNHLLTHVEGRTFKCSKCERSFKSQRYLDSHMKTHQPKPRLKPTPKNDKLDVVKEKRSYQCGYCGKISTHHFTHKNHMRRHTQERPCKCNTCGKDFRTNSALQTHLRIHDDVRPYKCEYCSHAFRQSAHLKEHRMIHRGQTPYSCSTCGMTFTKKSNMIVHQRVHSGEKPYKCNACQMEFKKLILLKRHVKMKHYNENYEELSKSAESVAYDSELNLNGEEYQSADIDVGDMDLEQQCTDTLSSAQFSDDLNNVNIETGDSTIVFVVDDTNFNSLCIMNN